VAGGADLHSIFPIASPHVSPISRYATSNITSPSALIFRPHCDTRTAAGGRIHRALIEHSPLKQAAFMPDIPYLTFTGQRFSREQQKHSDRFVAELRSRGSQGRILEVPGMGHGNAVPYHARENRSTS